MATNRICTRTAHFRGMNLLRGCLISTLVCFSAQALANPVTAPTNAETTSFSQYMSDVKTFDGIFHGVLDYCQSKISADMKQRASQNWSRKNAPFLTAADFAVQDFVERHIEAFDRERVTRELRSLHQGWFDKVHDQNRMLTAIRSAPDERLACAKYLGSMRSDSYRFAVAAPESYEHWRKQLHPRINAVSTPLAALPDQVE